MASRLPLALFAVTALAIGGVSVAGIELQRVIHSADQALADASLDVVGVERLRSYRERSARKLRSFLLTGHPRFVDEMDEADRGFDIALASLRTGDAAERAVADELAELEQRRRVQAATAIAGRARVEGEHEVIDLPHQDLVETIDAALSRVVAERKAVLDRHRAASQAASQRASTLLWAAGGLALIISALSSLALRRALRRIEGRAARAVEHLAAIVESSEDAIVSVDLSGTIQSWNSGAQKLFGYSAEEVVGNSMALLASPTAPDDSAQILASIARGESLKTSVVQRRSKGGAVVQVALSVSPVRHDDGEIVGASLIARDLTRERRLEMERNRFFEMSSDLVCVAGTDGYFKQLNPAFQVVLGHRPEELMAAPLIDFVHPEDRHSTLAELTKLASGRSVVDFQNRFRMKNGDHKWLCWNAVPDPSGLLYAVARDVTERVRSQAQLSEMAEEMRALAVLDDLTGLHNRRGFRLLAEQQIKRAAREGQGLCFFFADLDGLKTINDQLGHELGDQAIRDAAKVLESSVRKSDIVCRLGGDEFAILTVDATLPAATEVERRIEDHVRQYNQGQPAPPFALSMSVGHTTYDPRTDTEDVDAVLKRADQVMYQKKARKKALRRA